MTAAVLFWLFWCLYVLLVVVRRLAPEGKIPAVVDAVLIAGMVGLLGWHEFGPLLYR